MIDIVTARACIKALADASGARVIEPGDARVSFGLTIAQGIAGLVPGGASVLSELQQLIGQANETVSVTVPAPGGTLIILSKAAVADGSSYLATGLHELVHVKQIAKVGAAQAVVDYLGSGELRSERESEASGVGMWARYVVTGSKPDPEDASILRSALYHLDPPDKDFARACVRSVLGVVESGAQPPFSVAQSCLGWLKKNAPEAILVADYR